MSRAGENRQLVESVVAQVSSIVSKIAGIQLGQRQYSMVENRLRTRMVRLKLDDFSQYLSFLKANTENESQALLSLLTTHHTYFFREFSHFEFLVNALPRLIERAKNRGDKKIKIWSAAASRGQEAYSLAMFFDFHLKPYMPEFDFEIWGTDVDPESIGFAQNGVYKNEELKKSPAMYLSDHWIRGKGNVSEFVKLKDSIKSKCHFSTANLLSAETFLSGKSFDLIFCRNVFIYFNQIQIKDCTKTMIQHLDPQGFLFLGVSESLNGLGLPIETKGPSIYEKPQPKSTAVAFKPLTEQKIEKKILDVLCVDDSKAIHAILGKILTPDQGYRIKAKALNGLEALEYIKKENFDLITLDMHMPELDGIGFLEKSADMNRPAVVILSSVNRDDLTIAQTAMRLGAKDYIEKPSLENIAEASNEIRSKLRSAYNMHNLKVEATLENKKVSPKSLIAKKKKVLIVDDSKTIRQLLTKIINLDSMLEVVAEAEKPSEVEGLIKKFHPDVITLDIHMPEMDGVTLLKNLFPIYKIPTVMISSISREEGTQVLDALESGAVDYIQKPQLSDLAEVGQQIRERLRIASEVRIRQRQNSVRKVKGVLNQQKIIAMGASTGGTEALREVLAGLPEQIPPILIVQHIPPVFSAAFAQRLNSIMPFEVKEAVDGEDVKPNTVYIAPGGRQMAVKRIKDKILIRITDDPPVNRHKPSVDHLFKSINETGLNDVVCALLTGMGADGAREMKNLKLAGARTIAQNKESSVVFGMPREAIEMGAAEYVVSLDGIAEKICLLCALDKNRKSA